MAQNHIEQVLKTAGLPDDQIKALNDLPEDSKDFKPDQFIAPIKSTFENQVKNDPKFYEGLNKENLPKEFIQKLETEQYGRSASIVRQNILKTMGMSEKDFADLGEDGKKLDIFLPAFVKKLSEGKVGDKELQAKLIEANTEIEKLKGQFPEIENKFKGEFESKMNDFAINQSILTILASVPGLTAPAKYVSERLIKDLKAKYGFSVEGDSVELRQKEKPTLKVLIDNGTKELTLTAAINQILEADGLVDKKRTTVTTQTTKVDVGQNGLVMHQKVNDKVRKRIEEDQRAAQ